MTNLEKAKKVIRERYVPCGIYNSRNFLGDPMDTIYTDDNLQIDICYYYDYFEVFGLTDAEFAELKKYYEELGAVTWMHEYIDKEAIAKAFNNDSQSKYYQFEVISRLRSIPTADVRENVKAEWENVEVTEITDINIPSAVASMLCPVCKRYHNEVYFYGRPTEMARFCGFCGAQMGGAEDD
jgi:hypothetical protein